MYFDLSGVTNTIASATLYFKGSGAAGIPTSYLVPSSQGSPLSVSDYSRFTYTNLGKGTTWPQKGVQGSITLNAAGISYLNSMIGKTAKMAMIGGSDYSDNTPVNPTDIYSNLDVTTTFLELVFVTP